MNCFQQLNTKDRKSTNLALLEEMIGTGIPVKTSTFSMDKEFLVPTLNIKPRPFGLPMQFLRFSEWMGYRGPGMNMPTVVSFLRSHNNSVFEDGSIVVFFTTTVFLDFVNILKEHVLPTVTGRSYQQLFPTTTHPSAQMPVAVSVRSNAVSHHPAIGGKH